MLKIITLTTLRNLLFFFIVDQLGCDNLCPVGNSNVDGHSDGRIRRGRHWRNCHGYRLRETSGAVSNDQC